MQVDKKTSVEPVVKLAPHLLFGRQVHALLNENGGKLLFSNFDSFFFDRFGVPCRPTYYGFANSISLLHSIPQIITVRGKGTKKVLTISRQIEGMYSFIL